MGNDEFFGTTEDAQSIRHARPPECCAPDQLEPVVDRPPSPAGEGRALEFAIGTGRVAVPLRERGVAVTGFQNCRRRWSIAVADEGRRSRNSGAGDRRHGDDVRPGALASLVLSRRPHPSSNLLTQDAQVACFQNAARHLDPRRQVRDRAPGHRGCADCLPPRRPWFRQLEPGYIGLGITLDALRQHVVSHHFGSGDDRQATLARSSHRYVWPAELDLMARLAGFELEARSPRIGEGRRSRPGLDARTSRRCRLLRTDRRPSRGYLTQRLLQHAGELGLAIGLCQQQHALVEAAVMHDRVLGIARGVQHLDAGPPLR